MGESKSVTELDDIGERIKVYFLNEIMDLSNNEVEVVLDYLIRYFDESLGQVRAATTTEA